MDQQTQYSSTMENLGHFYIINLLHKHRKDYVADCCKFRNVVNEVTKCTQRNNLARSKNLTFVKGPEFLDREFRMRESSG
jgi:hypothetical protein